MTKSMTDQPRNPSPDLPKWVKPQLCKLVDAPPQGPEWLHEIKYDGYRMHARLDHGRAQLLKRNGLDWTHKYPSIAAALSVLPANQAYFDGELCGVTRDGKTSFSMIQAASDSGNAGALVFFLFDLLFLDGETIIAAPLRVRKERLRNLLSNAGAPLQYSDHQIGRGPEFYARACELSASCELSEGVNDKSTVVSARDPVSSG
jgi:ATP-dependent DNA ligase